MSLQCPLQVCYNSIGQILTAESVESILWVLFLLHRGGIMKIINLKIDVLKPYDKNPRKNKEAVKYVAESIKEFGFKQPIVIDKNNVIVCGHTRLLAAKQLGLKEVPCILADDLTEEQINAYRLVDNKTNEFAEWDNELLKEELFKLPSLNMKLFGFEEEQKEEQIAEEDNYEEPEQLEPIVKKGQVWQLGVHRLMCGDSTKKEDVDKLMDGKKADLVFTDPPYGYEYKSNHQDKFEMLKNDDKILDYVSAVFEYLKENCAIYSFCGWQTLKKWLEYFESTDLILKNIIIWKKNNWSMGDLKGTYAGQYEIILYLNKGRVELNWKRDTDIWEFDREPPKMHPTMKPIDLITFALKHSSKDNDIILDVFGGSGSTLIACEQLNRKCYMMELDEHYCDVIINRWESFTGKKAELIE